MENNWFSHSDWQYAVTILLPQIAKPAWIDEFGEPISMVKQQHRESMESFFKKVFNEEEEKKPHYINCKRYFNNKHLWLFHYFTLSWETIAPFKSAIRMSLLKFSAQWVPLVRHYLPLHH